MNIVKTKPEFSALTVDEVTAALEDVDPTNPIAVEIARLVDGYATNFAAHVEKLGSVPANILRSTGDCPIEQIAMQITTQTIREALEENEG